MADTQSLLRTKKYCVCDSIKIYVPDIGEIYDYGESEYYRIVRLLTSVPYDLMVELDDAGIDYETITEYQLFLMILELFKEKQEDLSMVFDSFDISSLHARKNTQTGEIALFDRTGTAVVNRTNQIKIGNAIRKLHFWEKTLYKAGNKEAKEYLIERNRKKKLRAARRPQTSFLDESIIKLVNTEEFKYNYEECMNLSIYKFNASLYQIPKKKNWEQTMNGAYFGTVDLSKIDMEKIHWMSSIV